MTKKGKIDYEKFEGEEITTCTYYVDDNHYCTVEFSSGLESYNTKITVVGAPEQFKQMKSEASKAKAGYEDENSWLNIKSNIIEWGSGS